MSPRRPAVLLALTVALTGCGVGPGGSSDEETTVGHLTVTVPDGWTEEEGSGKWDKKFVGDGIEMQVSGTFSKDPSATTAFSRLDLPATTQLSDYRQTQPLENPEIDGADTSVRADYSYSDDGRRMEGVWIIAGQWPDPSTAVISLSGESLESSEVKSIVDSLEFEKSEGM